MSRQAVLLVNLGSPDSTSVRDVRRYLREFLMDGRVMDIPYLARLFVVYCCILPKRPKQSVEAYRSIWLREGSPLIVTGWNVQEKLQERVGMPVELAMRYQNPSIESAIDALRARGVEELLVIPLFPHYAMSSYETAVERVKSVAESRAPEMRLTIVPPYYNEPDYIDALVDSARDYLDCGYDHLLFSFHGLPERHLRKTDPTGIHCLATHNCCALENPAHPTCYRAQCFKTVSAFVEKAGVPPELYSVAFQSRLGSDPWMQPFTDRELVRLARQGVKKLLVICPAFVADCLETLEEIAIRGAETFREAGGRELVLVPCLNENATWLNALENIVARHFQPTAEMAAGGVTPLPR
jgi:ferrochelatase